jgi:hypothetical protein
VSVRFTIPELILNWNRPESLIRQGRRRKFIFGSFNDLPMALRLYSVE